MRLGLVILCFLSLTCLLQAQEFDPAYVKTFGHGVILASNKGFPSFSKYDPAQIKFKNGTSFIKPSEGSTLDLRQINPAGTDVAKILAKVVADQSENANFRDEKNLVFWDFWVSHDNEGTPLFNTAKPWPTSTKDIPKWGSRAYIWYEVPDAPMTSGASWEDLSSEFSDWLSNAKPGWKIWVSVSYGFKYQSNAGAVENKWNPDKQKFEQVVSSGELGFAKSEPIVAGTIEIE
ncbi:MAG: hypothetical protein A2W80_17745 [Candidatus Riflebacteria bacterium GWC2_50_8]|nr:MAG: hypothetical protein A2W80_17745 [Candidatus Riflebacteria bacterium GWC2_50_8]